MNDVNSQALVELIGATIKNSQTNIDEGVVRFYIATIEELDTLNGRARVSFVGDIRDAAIETNEDLSIGDTVLVIYTGSKRNSFIIAKYTSTSYNSFINENTKNVSFTNIKTKSLKSEDISSDTINGETANVETVNSETIQSDTVKTENVEFSNSKIKEVTNNIEIETNILKLAGSMLINDKEVLIKDSVAFGENGYIVFTNGLKIQWGRQRWSRTNVNKGGTLTFPLSFETENYSITAMQFDSSTNNYHITCPCVFNKQASSCELTCYVVNNGSYSAGYDWIAIGN